MYLIRPTDPNRRAIWMMALGRDTLPVCDGRAYRGADGRLFFDVDLSRLTAVETSRLAAYAARQNRGGYFQAADRVNDAGAAIPAVGCELIEETAVPEGEAV